MIPPPIQTTEGVCNQFPLLIIYYTSSRLLTLLKVTDTPTQVSDILVLTVSFKFSNFSFHIYIFFLFLKCLLASGITQFTLSTLLWFGSCNQCILNCFLLHKNHENSSSNHGLCCIHSYRSRLFSVEILIFFLMF